MNCNINSDTKFYICKYGIFYEGEELEEYVSSNGNTYYLENVILDKFIVHYNEDKTPYLCFRYKNFRNKVTWTQNCKVLGTYFRKIKKN